MMHDGRRQRLPRPTPQRCRPCSPAVNPRAGPQPWQAGAGAPRFVPSTEMFGLPPALTYHPADRGGRLRGARVADDSFHRPLVRRPGWRLVPACGNKEVDARRPVDGQAGLEGAGWMHCTGRTLKLVMIRELAALAQIHPTRSRALPGAGPGTSAQVRGGRSGFRLKIGAGRAWGKPPAVRRAVIQNLSLRSPPAPRPSAARKTRVRANLQGGR